MALPGKRRREAREAGKGKVRRPRGPRVVPSPGLLAAKFSAWPSRERSPGDRAGPRAPGPDAGRLSPEVRPRGRRGDRRPSSGRRSGASPRPLPSRLLRLKSSPRPLPTPRPRAKLGEATFLLGGEFHYSTHAGEWLRVCCFHSRCPSGKDLGDERTSRPRGRPALRAAGGVAGPRPGEGHALRQLMSAAELWSWEMR